MGSMGNKGNRGNKGNKGNKCNKGNKGNMEKMGSIKGMKGDMGHTGIMGNKSNKGNMENTGIMVKKGNKMVPDFAADGKGKMAKGGKVHKDAKMDKSMMQKAVNKHEGRLHKGESMTKLAKGGGIEVKGKTKGTMVKMARGGKAC
jgi:hypothetical protein